jgi:hypothetical protein
MSKHTAGEWRADVIGANVIIGTDAQNIAEMIHDTEDGDEILANGRLMAAAPAFLAAVTGNIDEAAVWPLEWAETLARTMLEGGSIDACRAEDPDAFLSAALELSRMCKGLRAALAKAGAAGPAPTAPAPVHAPAAACDDIPF